MADNTIDELGRTATEAETDQAPSGVSADARKRRGRGESVGRYLVLERVGAGGMGVVYAAYDPTLDRRVALKLLHPRTTSSSGEYQRRLLREAQAMAKLSHPNVVTVHDVELVDNRVVVAMEYVRDGSLDQWLKGGDGNGRRPWREVLDMFVEAGKGLAAAHAGGLIHRDFKPSNVLVGKNGRPRVTDFGLARPEGDTDVSSEDATGSPALQTPMTQTGAIMGTPAYMAPEQHVGGQADARADQFSFCVSLYEGLYGERPFAGGTAAQVVQAIERGDVRDEPKDTQVPRWLRQVLLRGVRAARQERYASMDELLAELSRDRTSRVGRGVALFAGLGVLIFAVNAATQPTSAKAPDVCAAAADGLTAVWGDAQRADVRKKLEGTAVTYARDVANSIVPRIDAFASQWATMRTDSCRATKERAEQSDNMMDRRAMCLDARLQSLASFVAVLTTKPSKAVVDKAIGMARGLPQLAECADKKTLLLAVPPPPGAAIRAKIIEYDREIADIGTLTSMGKSKDALKRASALVVEVDKFPYARTRALALLRKGIAQSRLAKPEGLATLRRGLKAAHEGHQVATIRAVWFLLIETLGDELKKPKDALALVPYAEAAVAGAANPRIWGGVLLSFTGSVRLAAGDQEGALRDLKRAVEILKDSKIAPNGTLRALGSLTQLYFGQRKLGEAKKVLAQLAVELKRRHGERHLTLGQVYGNMGILAMREQKLGEARELMVKSLAIKRQVIGEDHYSVLDGRSNVAMLDFSQGKVKQARAELEALAKAYERVRGPDHTDVATVLQQLAEVSITDATRYAASVKGLQRALAIQSKKQGAKHPAVAAVHRVLSQWHWVAKQYGKCVEAARSGLAIIDTKKGKPSWRVGVLRGRVGTCLVGDNKHAAAISELEQALAILKRYPQLKPSEQAHVEFNLARALWAKKRDRTRARALVTRARKRYVKAGTGAKERLKELDAWAAKHMKKP